MGKKEIGGIREKTIKMTKYERDIAKCRIKMLEQSLKDMLYTFRELKAKIELYKKTKEDLEKQIKIK